MKFSANNFQFAEAGYDFDLTITSSCSGYRVICAGMSPRHWWREGAVGPPVMFANTQHPHVSTRIGMRENSLLLKGLMGRALSPPRTPLLQEWPQEEEEEGEGEEQEEEEEEGDGDVVSYTSPPSDVVKLGVATRRPSSAYPHR